MDDMQLSALLAADMPPAQDPYFVMAVMARAEQSRFRREMIRSFGLCAAAIVLLALVMPGLNLNWVGNLSPANDLALGVALMAATIFGPRMLGSLES